MMPRLFSLLLLLCGGCRMLNHGDREDAPTAPAPAGQVLVGGRVVSPGHVTIPAGGLRLGDVIDLAGGLRQSSVGQIENPAVEFTPLAKSRIEAARRSLGALLQAAREWTPESLPAAVTVAGNGAIRDVAAAFDDRTLPNAVISSARQRFETNYRVWLVRQTAENMQQLINDAEVLAKAVDEYVASIQQRPIGIRLGAAGSRTLFVSLRRGTGAAASSHHFPYRTAVDGFARDIPVQNGDSIRVVGMDELSLNYANEPRVADAGKRFLVSGFIKSPGARRASLPINDYLAGDKEPKIETVSGAATDQLVMAITRTTSTGLGRDVFVLPFNGLGSSEIGTARLLAGDDVRVVPFYQVPLVLRSMLRDHLASVPEEYRQVRNKALFLPGPAGELQRAHRTYLQPLAESVRSLTPRLPRAAAAGFSLPDTAVAP